MRVDSVCWHSSFAAQLQSGILGIQIHNWTVAVKNVLDISKHFAGDDSRKMTVQMDCPICRILLAPLLSPGINVTWRKVIAAIFLNLAVGFWWLLWQRLVSLVIGVSSHKFLVVLKDVISAVLHFNVDRQKNELSLFVISKPNKFRHCLKNTKLSQT